MAKNKDLLNGNIVVQLMSFFIPVLLTYVFQQLYNTMDAMIVGRFVGKEALAAVGGTTGTSIGLILGFILGLASGVTVIVAQYFGRKDLEGVENTVKTGFTMSFIVGLLMSIVGIITTPGLLNLLNVPEDIYELSVIYMRIYYIGMMPTLVYNTGASILRAIGDSKRPLYFLIISSVINIILDYILVRFTSLGVKGAAIATVISQVASMFLILFVFSKNKECYGWHYKNVGIDFDLIKKIVHIGLPAGIQSVVYSITNLYIQACVNSFGTNTVAGYSALGKVDCLFWYFSAAFGISVTTLVGQNYGAHKIDRVKKIMNWSYLLYTLMALAIAGFCYIYSNELIGLFSKDIEVIEIGSSILEYLCFLWVLFMPVEVISSSIKACGDVIAPMWISIIGIAGVRIIYLAFIPFDGVIGAMKCYPISWIITGVAYIIYFVKGNSFQKTI